MTNEEIIQILIQAQNQASGALKEASEQLTGVGTAGKKAGDDVKSTESSWKDAANSMAQMATSGNLAATAMSALGLTAVATAAMVIENMARMGAASLAATEGFRVLAEQAGMSSNEIIDAMVRASDGTISEEEAIRASSSLLATGVNLTAQQIEQLTTVARVHAQMVGISTADAYGTLTRAVEYGYTRGLRNIDMVVNSTQAMKTYADSIDTLPDKLTEEQRQQAILNAILDQGNKGLDDMSKSATSADTAFRQLSTDTSNLRDKIQEGMAPAVGDLIGKVDVLVNKLSDLSDNKVWQTLSYAAGNLNLTSIEFTLMGKSVEGAQDSMNKMVDMIPGLRQRLDELGTGVGGVIDQFIKLFNLGDSVGNGIGKSITDFSGLLGTAGSKAGDFSEIYRKAIISGADALAQYKTQLSDLKDAHQKTMNDLTTQWKDMEAKVIDDRIAATDKMIIDISKQEQDLSKNIVSANESYNKSIEAMNYSRAKNYEQLSRDEVTIETDKAKQIQAVNDTLAKNLLSAKDSLNKSLDSLSRDSLDKEMNAKTYMDVLRIRSDEDQKRKELQDNASAKEQELKTNANAKMQDIQDTVAKRQADLAQRKADMDEQYQHERELAAQSRDDSIQKSREQTAAAIEDIKVQEQSALTSINVKRIADENVINLKREKENASYEETKKKDQTQFDDRMKKLFDTRTELQKVDAAWLQIGGSIDAATRSLIIHNGALSAATAGGLTSGQTGRSYQGQGYSGPGYAAGGSFTVPPGFSNDTYQMRASSGEHVTITPAGQTSMPSITITGNTIFGAEDLRAVVYGAIQQWDLNNG